MQRVEPAVVFMNFTITSLSHTHMFHKKKKKNERQRVIYLQNLQKIKNNSMHDFELYGKKKLLT